MGCVCIQQLKIAVENLKKLPLATLASLIPSDLPIAKMGQLSSVLMASAAGSASATAQARASAMAQLAASARLSASVNMNLVAQLEAMAQMQQVFGVSPFSANASAQLGIAITSMNQNLPPLMAMMLDMLAPLAEKFAALAAMLSTSAVVNHTLGLDLSTPAGMANLQAALQAQASASAAMSATASASASAEASAAATMNLAAHLRLAAAARLLGIDLLAPGGSVQLAAALNVAAKLGLPALTVDMGQMGALASALGQISAAQAALNLNFALPNASALLAAALAPLLASMNMAGSLNLQASAAASASASASMSAQAALAASMSATSTAQMQALAALDLRGMVLPPLPNMGSLSLAATLTEQLSLSAGASAMQTHPCSSCPVAGAF